MIKSRISKHVESYIDRLTSDIDSVTGIELVTDKIKLGICEVMMKSLIEIRDMIMSGNVLNIQALINELMSSYTKLIDTINESISLNQTLIDIGIDFHNISTITKNNMDQVILTCYKHMIMYLFSIEQIITQ